MKHRFRLLARCAYALLALGALAMPLLPIFAQDAAAAGQVSTRSIQISNATASASGVSYLVTFTPATTAAQSLVIDFCMNSPIIGGACTTTNDVTATSATFTAGTGTTNWVIGSAGATTVKLNKGTGSNLGTSAISFTLGNITNPTSTGSFYARVYTYCDTGYGATCGGVYTNQTTLGTYMDYGGFALSTASSISITATVMETLTFCVSKAAPGSACTATSAPTLTIGHNSPLTLDSSVVDTDTAYTQLSTNANGGVSVALKVTSSTTCAGLSRDGGATCGIPGKGAFGAITAGTAAFGLNVADGTGGTGTVSHNANYGTTAGSYGMGTATFGTYGDPIESSTGAVANVNSLLTYGATASTTTPAGVYSTTESLIATGTF